MPCRGTPTALRRAAAADQLVPSDVSTLTQAAIPEWRPSQPGPSRDLLGEAPDQSAEPHRPREGPPTPCCLSDATVPRLRPVDHIHRRVAPLDSGRMDVSRVGVRGDCRGGLIESNTVPTIRMGFLGGVGAVTKPGGGADSAVGGRVLWPAVAAGPADAVSMSAVTAEVYLSS